MTRHALSQVSRYTGAFLLPSGVATTLRAGELEGLSYVPELAVVEAVVGGQAYWFPVSRFDRMDPAPPAPEAAPAPPELKVSDAPRPVQPAPAAGRPGRAPTAKGK